MNLSPPPCYNCITLAICRNKIARFIERDDPLIFSGISHLSIACHMIADYFGPYLTYKMDNKRLTIHYLTGLDLVGITDISENINEIYASANMENPYETKSNSML